MSKKTLHSTFHICWPSNPVVRLAQPSHSWPSCLAILHICACWCIAFYFICLLYVCSSVSVRTPCVVSYSGGSDNIIWPSDTGSSISPRSYLSPSSGSSESRIRLTTALSQPSKCIICHRNSMWVHKLIVAILCGLYLLCLLCLSKLLFNFDEILQRGGDWPNV